MAHSHASATVTTNCSSAALNSGSPLYGIVACGPDVVTAVMTAILLERACRTNVRAIAGGGPRTWSSDEEALSKRDHCYPPQLLRQAWDYMARRL